MSKMRNMSKMSGAAFREKKSLKMSLTIIFGLSLFQYLPIEGLAAFNKATAELLLGADSPAIKQGRVGGHSCVGLDLSVSENRFKQY